MKITQLYITSHLENTSPQFRGRYQNLAAYLTEFVSHKINKLKLDLGPFNRIIFEEGGTIDLKPRGEKAFGISLAETFPGFENFESAEEIHNYYSDKYLEGLRKLDNHFGCNTARLMENEFKTSFPEGPYYERVLASRGKYKVLGRWFSDEYRVILCAKGEKDIVIYHCPPDPFVIDYDVKKISLTDLDVTVINKVREITIFTNLRSGI